MGRAFSPKSDARGAPRWLYILEQSDVGIIQLDHDMRIRGVNAFARRELAIPDPLPTDLPVAQLLPESAQAKLAFMTAQATHDGTLPATMILPMPDRALLLKMSRVGGHAGELIGYAIIFHDISRLIEQGLDDDEPGDHPAADALDAHFLVKIPTARKGRTILVDLADIAYIRSDGHYTWVHTDEGSQFCNLTISALQARLDPTQFLRVHRSYIVNLSFIHEVVRDDGRMTLRMKGNVPSSVPVSRSSANSLQERLGLVALPHGAE
jgi:DNA-binding LytR/AlgR family response regulator